MKTTTNKRAHDEAIAAAVNPNDAMWWALAPTAAAAADYNAMASGASDGSGASVAANHAAAIAAAVNTMYESEDNMNTNTNAAAAVNAPAVTPSPLQIAVNAANAGMSGKQAAAAANKPAAAAVNAPAAATPAPAAKKARRRALDNPRNMTIFAGGLEKGIPEFIAAHSDVTAAEVNTWTDKNGHGRCELLVTSTLCRGRVHVEVKAGCGLEVDRDKGGLDVVYTRNRDKLIAKERATSPTKPARRAAETKAQLRAQIDAQAAQIAALVAACAAAGIAVPAAATC